MSQDTWASAIENISIERDTQDEKWGDQNHNNYRWLAILSEEIGELAKEINEDDETSASLARIQEELCQVATVAVAWMECLMRNNKG